MGIKLNLLRELKINSSNKQSPHLSLSAKIFLVFSFALIIVIVFIVGRGSLKALHNAEKFEVNKSTTIHTIPLPKIQSPVEGIANSLNSNTSQSSKINVSFEEIDLSRGFILSDMGEKISSKFTIPDGKEKSVAFWFDLYTKYSNSDIIIFNKKYPSLIYEVISTKNMKHKITPEELKFKIDKIKWTLTEMLEKENLTSNEEMALFSTYNDSIGFEPSKVKDSLNSIDYTVGLKETFTFKMNSLHKLLKTIEALFAKNKVDTEYTRIFLTSPLVKLNQNQNILMAPQLSEALKNKFLLENTVLNESHSSIKVAQILSVLLKNLKNKSSLFTDDWIEFNGDLESAFLAALHADEYYQEVFSKTKPSNALPIKAYRLKEKTSLSDLIKVSKMTAQDFLEINSDINIQNFSLTKLNHQKDYLLFNLYASHLILPKAFTFFVY